MNTNALTAVERPFAYVASPYSGATAAEVAANVERARAYSLAVFNAGYTPLTPQILFTQYLQDDDPAQRAAGIAMANSLLRLCRVVSEFSLRENDAEIRDRSIREFQNASPRTSRGSCRLRG